MKCTSPFSSKTPTEWGSHPRTSQFGWCCIVKFMLSNITTIILETLVLVSSNYIQKCTSLYKSFQFNLISRKCTVSWLCNSTLSSIYNSNWFESFSNIYRLKSFSCLLSNGFFQIDKLRLNTMSFLVKTVIWYFTGLQSYRLFKLLILMKYQAGTWYWQD